MKLVIAIVVTALFGWSIMYAVDVNNQIPFAYVGEETFWTEEEYVEFKIYLADEKNVLLEVSALSSKPPIIVEYEIRIPLEEDFRYTWERRYRSYKSLDSIAGSSALCAVAFMATLIAWVVVFAKPEAKEA